MPSYFPVAHLLSWEIADPGTVGIFQWPSPESPNEIAPVWKPAAKEVDPLIANERLAWRVLPCWLADCLARSCASDGKRQERREREQVGGASLYATATPPTPQLSLKTNNNNLKFIICFACLSLVPGAPLPSQCSLRLWMVAGSLKMCQLESFAKIFDDGHPHKPSDNMALGVNRVFVSASPITLGEVSCLGSLLRVCECTHLLLCLQGWHQVLNFMCPDLRSLQ